MDPQDFTNTLTFETSRLKSELADLNRLGASFGATLTHAFTSAIGDGRKLSDVLRGLALSFANRALDAALKPLGQLFPFADGGIVNSPVLFPFQGGTGLAGEAGPEAILPLARGADGKLGVKGGSGVHVTVNITTPDAKSFRQSQSQLAAMMARAIERGQRNL
jgi:phage-related minor tail protein